MCACVISHLPAFAFLPEWLWLCACLKNNQNEYQNWNRQKYEWTEMKTPSSNSVFNDLRVTSAVKSGRHFPRNVPSRSTFHSGEFCFKNQQSQQQLQQQTKQQYRLHNLIALLFLHLSHWFFEENYSNLLPCKLSKLYMVL